MAEKSLDVQTTRMKCPQTPFQQCLAEPLYDAHQIQNIKNTRLSVREKSPHTRSNRPPARSAANAWRCALTQENKNAYSSEIEVHLFVFRRARKQLFIPRHAINLTFWASYCTGLKQTNKKKHNIIRTTRDTARNNDDIIVTSTKSHFHRCAARLWFCTTSLFHPGPAAGLAEFNNPFVLSNIFFVITASVLLLFFNLSLLCKRSL